MRRFLEYFLAAISCQDGPTNLVDGAWQAVQPYLSNSVPIAGGTSGPGKLVLKTVCEVGGTGRAAIKIEPKKNKTKPLYIDRIRGL